MDDARGAARRVTTGRPGDPGLLGIGTTPPFAIGQRALLVQTAPATCSGTASRCSTTRRAAHVERRGGLAAIAISHPHYYSAMVEWAHAFDCPIYLHAADARSGSCAPTRRSSFWDGETHELGDGLTLIRCGGHFERRRRCCTGPGRGGALLSGDIVQVIPDRRYVSFMYSYPNLIPLPPARSQGDRGALDAVRVRRDLRRVVGRDHPRGRPKHRAPLGRALPPGRHRTGTSVVGHAQGLTPVVANRAAAGRNSPQREGASLRRGLSFRAINRV